MKQKPKGTAEVEQLRAIKERDQASNEEIARKIGVSTVTVFRWFERDRLPSPMGLNLLRLFLQRDERDKKKRGAK